MSQVSPEKLRDIKNRLESSCCALCEGERLEIEMPDTRIRSIFPIRDPRLSAGTVETAAAII